MKSGSKSGVFSIPVVTGKRKTIENSGINSDEKAWLAFLCMDEPKTVIDLIERYPRFKELYEDVYEICRNMENFMDIFSRELRTLDQNTVRNMIDQLQEDIDRQNQLQEVLSRLSALETGR